MNAPVIHSPKKSAATPAAGLVSGLAWSFIILAVISMLLALMQYVLFTHLVPMGVVREMLADVVRLNVLPAWIITLIENMRGVSIALFASGVLTLVISIALLKRRGWARVAFAWMMILTALAHLAGALIPLLFLQGAAPPSAEIPQELRGMIVMVKIMLTVIGLVMGIVFGACFAWVAKRLFDADIRREFTA